MGGVVEGGVGIADKTSPRRAAIDKVQAELRQEYDFREKRKRELEFLEKGGDPLEFIKDKNAASVSVQSTSFTDQLPDQLTSEAKGSFALTASPHGDSVESSGRLGANPCEPNSADNLMLFDAEHEASEGDRNSLHPSKSATLPSEKLSRMDGHQRSREHGDSASFGLTRKAYRRRNRTRPNRDVTRSSSTDLNPTCGSHGSSFPSHHGPTEVKEFLLDAEIQNASSNRKSKLSSPTVGTLHKAGSTDGRQDTELACGKTVESTKNLIEGVPLDTASDAVASETAMDNQHNQQSPSGDQNTPIKMDSEGPKAIQAVEEMASVDVECLPSVTAVKVENLSSSCQLTGFSSKTGEAMKKDEHSSNASRGIKVLDSESSCTHSSLNIDGNNGSEMHTKPRNGDSNGKIKDQSSVPDGMPVVEGDGLVKEKKETEGFDSSTLVNMESNSAGQGQRENGFKHLPEVVLNQSRAALENKENDECVGKVVETCGPTGSESGRKPSEMLGDDPGPHNENSCNVRDEDSINVSISDLQNGGTVSMEAQTSSGAASKVPRKIDDDSILKEARIIEAKRKRIAELSVAIFPKKIPPKSHWDYVLEEMAWLANDFAQERVWKIAAAAQIGTRAAFAFRSRTQEKYSGMIAKKVANHLAKSVMEFWHSVEGTSKVVEQQSQRDRSLSVRAYALRFLEYTKSSVVHQAEVPLTPDRLSDLGVLELSREDNLTEENLFYTVPPGAMEAYKNSIESCVSLCERIGSSLQEEVETSACDAAGEFESQDDVYYEDEGETNTYDMPMAFEGSRSSRPGQKKRKQSTHAYRVRPYDASTDMAIQHAENKVVAQQSALMGKRPGGSLNPLIPTKRVRTASRRVTSPFSIGTIGCVPGPKADASSGDTNSFQDDHSTLRGGSLVPSNLEVDSVADFERHLPFDSAEVSTKHKKKKKAKHLNAAYEAPWQVDPTFQNEQFQRDHWRKCHQVDSNGSSGLLGQPMVKKPKTMLQSQDNSFENMTPIGGSVPSPAASQMSNMSNPNKFIKMLGGRDRGRKPKVLKMPAGQACSGSPWTLFEDQALVVLVHDLGPNWELVSDVINSTMQFKCIFRKAKECKERHNILMDITSGDGADSAEDSGSSQPYPSTLPGIPKGSARQLFQRLQGPMEEDTIKSHFEKIIGIGQKQDYRRTQNDNQDLKLQQPHCSHAIALSQVCPNNLNAVPVLTPLDLCDATIPGCDALPLGYQGPHSGGLAFPSQGTATTMHPTSGASASQASPNMMFCNNFSSSPGSLNSSVRDGRYGVPRSTSLSTDEQRRSQQYNQMVAGRNVLQPNISASGAHLGTERGVRLLPGSNGVGIVCGANRNMPMTRHGFQGVGSSIANSGSMVSPGMSGANMHSGVGSGQRSSMLRPRETLNVMRPGLSQDSPRQMMVPDRQMQVSPGTSQGLSHFGGLSSPFPNQTASPPVSSYPLHHQPSHPISPQQPQVLGPHHPHIQGSANHALSPQKQAYAIRLAKESQQHRFLQQQPQQPQFASSSPLMPHVQPQSQLPVSSPLQNSSQVLPQTCSPTVSLSPLASTSMNTMPQHQQKRQTPTQGVLRNVQSGGSGLTNQISKQRQSKQQQFSQANRQHPQQRQQLQAQHPAKVAKGVGRGNLMTHQNVSSIDPSLVNGATASPGNQFSEKEATTHLMQNQALYTSSALNTVQSTKQYVSSQSSNHNQSLPQLKIYSGQAASSTKQLHQPVDNNNQGHVPPVASGLPAGEPSSSSAMAGPNQQASSHQKLVNPSQASLKRVIQPNHQINSDPSNKPQARDSDTDQPPTSSSTGMDTRTALPQANNNTTNLVHANSPASAHQWHVSESHALNSATNLSTVVSVSSSESPLQVSQGLGQRLLSSSLPSIRHDPGAQWQQQRRPNSPVPQPQQHLQSLPPMHSQPQPHLLQAGNGNLYGENGDHRME